MFKDRVDAGRQLSGRLSAFAGWQDVVVLGIPRGGIPVAWQIAHALGAPLDVFLARKLGVPGNEELAFGAVSAESVCFVDPGIVRAAGVGPEDVERVVSAARRILEDKARLYRPDRPALGLADRVVILVDDGAATGASMAAALEAIRHSRPAELVAAVPVASLEAKRRLENSADLVVVLECPRDFFAVSEYYRDFRPTADEEVVALLASAPKVSERSGLD